MYAHLLCAHVGAHTHAPAYRSQKRNQVLTLSLSTLFSWDKFLTEPRDKSHQALAIILFLPPPIWCYRNDHGYDWLQYVDTGDLNLGLQVCTASTLIHWALLSTLYISFLLPEPHTEAYFAPSGSLQLNKNLPTLHSQQSRFDSGGWTVWVMLHLPRLPDPLSLLLILHMQ